MKTKCSNCGYNEYEIRITTDGYKEYVCKACGSIIDRVNLLEEYRQFSFNHTPFTTETDLLKLQKLSVKYVEDYNNVKNFINFLKCKKDSLAKNEYENEAINKMVNEFEKLLNNINNARDSVINRIWALKKEIAYNEVKQRAIKEYNKEKTYVNPDVINCDPNVIQNNTANNEKSEIGWHIGLLITMMTIVTVVVVCFLVAIK